jgi:hypothetical protein
VRHGRTVAFAPAGEAKEAGSVDGSGVRTVRLDPFHSRPYGKQNHERQQGCGQAERALEKPVGHIAITGRA